MPVPLRRLILGTSLLLAPLAGAPSFAQTSSAPPLRPATTTAVLPVELPAFQPGLWEYQRTMLTAANPKPQKSSIKKCGDPSSEIKQRLSELQQKGCQFSPLRPRGNRFLSMWKCPAPNGNLVIHNVVTVKSPTRYQDDNEVRAGERATRSMIVANRVGDCPAPQASAGTARERIPPQR
jgi:hypothetical protein